MSDLVLLRIYMSGLEYADPEYICWEYAMVPMTIVNALKDFIKDHGDEEVKYFADENDCTTIDSFQLTIFNCDSFVEITENSPLIIYHNNEKKINKYKLLGYEKFNANKPGQSIFDILLYRLACSADLHTFYGDLKITDHDRILYCIKRLSYDPYKETIEELKKMLNSNDYPSFKESLDKVGSLLNEL